MTARSLPLPHRAWASPWIVPMSLFALALIVRVWAASGVSFAPTEGSAYYVGVARNLVEGRGFVSDAVWSYGTPPLVLPKPAFELWLPMASLLAALSMTIMGTTLAAAQLSAALVGAAVAPLTWAVAREAAERHGLEPGRVSAVALGSGVVAAVLGPFLVAVMGPDSTTPFTTFAVAACLLMPRALGIVRGTAADHTRGASAPSILSRLLLGVVLGLAYLSRQEAAYLGIACLVLAFDVAPPGRAVSRLVFAARRLVPVAAAGGLTVAPWLVRNLSTFGSPFAAGTIDNALLTRNEQIFAYADQPSVAGFLAQGPSIVGNQLAAVSHNLLEVLLVPAAPVGLFGLLALVALRRSPAVTGGTALRALLISGVLTFLVTSLVFPVATLWGTFLHSSGPALVALTVLTMLGLDSLVATIRARRDWTRSNAWLAPAVVLALATPLALLQVTGLARRTDTVEARFEDVARSLSSTPAGVSAGRSTASVGRSNPSAGMPPRADSTEPNAPLVSDHPIWLAETLRRPVLALPDEPPRDVWRLARDFDAALLVVVDGRGRYPDVLATATDGAECFERLRAQPTGADEPPLIFQVRQECAR